LLRGSLEKVGDHTYGFEKLHVWQNARRLVAQVYKVTTSFPKAETYSLVDQIRRAAISVPANLAEGTSRISPKEQAHFTAISYGSLMELLSHCYLAMDLQYIDREAFDELRNNIFKISNELNALRKSQFQRDEKKC
jgi:four helix bundle protein